LLNKRGLKLETFYPASESPRQVFKDLITKEQADKEISLVKNMRRQLLEELREYLKLSDSEIDNIRKLEFIVSKAEFEPNSSNLFLTITRKHPDTDETLNYTFNITPYIRNGVFLVNQESSNS